MVRQHHAVLADGASQVRRHGLQRRAPDSVHRLVQHRAGGEKENGDHLIRIEDRKIAIAYAIEALKLFDTFTFASVPKPPTRRQRFDCRSPLLQGRSRGSTSTTGPATSRSATASSSPAEAALQRARSAAWPPGSFTERHGSRRYGWTVQRPGAVAWRSHAIKSARSDASLTPAYPIVVPGTTFVGSCKKLSSARSFQTMRESRIDFE